MPDVFTGLVGAAEDDALAVGRRQVAADAGTRLRRCVQRDAAGRGGGRGLDLLFALFGAAVEGAGPPGGYRLGEVVPVVDGNRVVVAEGGRPLQEEVLERVQFVGQAGRGAVEGDGLLLPAQAADHDRGARGQVARAQLQPDRDAAQLPLVELESRGQLRAVVDVYPNTGSGQPLG